MKNIITAFAVLFGTFRLCAQENEIDFSGAEECEFNRWYVGAAATMVIPGGGSEMRRLGGGTIRGGYYFAEFWAAEAEAAWLEDCAGLSAAVLWHWWGYERFDPFFTFGAKGWLGRGDTQVGPKAGTGFFYHLTDYWSLRFDADVTLGVESETEPVYSLSAGIQYSF